MRTKDDEEAMVWFVIDLLPPYLDAILRNYIKRLQAQRELLRLLWAAARDSGVVVPAGLLSDARATGAIRAIEEEAS